MGEELIKYDPQQVELIKNTVAKDATNAELEMFIQFCKATKLNPFKKEIWFIKNERNGTVQMMTGINGFLAIANNHPEFDGMEVSVNEENGKIISATAKVYRKDRKYPSVATVYLSEYFKPSKYGNGMWEKMPRMMLQKVAKSVALREAFPQELNGIYTQEEMPAEYAVEQQETPQIAEKKPTHKYAIQNFGDKTKEEKAIKWCESHQIDTVWEDDLGLVAYSEKELPFFKEVEIETK
jgi:phage recombination protein Bet